MTEEAMLVAEGVGRRYPRRKAWAVEDLDIKIPTGSITALVGPNGAGKSTLIRCWMGFERPDKGRVLVNGIDPAKNRVQAVELIGYVPQSMSLYRGLTVDDHFRFAAIYRPGFDRRGAVVRVRKFGVDSNRRIGELSGGEQAQVTLALALSMNAPVLLLDEPLASLDPLARRDFFTLLKEDVRSTGTTVVLSSHIVTDIQQACDWIVVLAGGRHVLHEPIEALRASYETVLESDLGGRTAVAAFTGPNGERLALLRTERLAGRSASLEEVVLGHLAIGQVLANRPGDVANGY